MKIRPLLILGLVVAAIIALFGIYLVYFADPLVSDRHLVEGFERDRDSLEKIKGIFNKSPEVTHVCCLSECRNYTLESKKESTQELCTLLESVDSTWADRMFTDEGAIIFISMDSRYLGASEDGGGVSAEKGYAYCMTEPTPIRDSLDWWWSPRNEAFRKLTDNWYVAYRVSESKPE
ncbi:MAG: hypothetical protein ABL984_11210 [Pyrinomonadaceae bacterium]